MDTHLPLLSIISNIFKIIVWKACKFKNVIEIDRDLALSDVEFIIFCDKHKTFIFAQLLVFSWSQCY